MSKIGDQAAPLHEQTEELVKADVKLDNAGVITRMGPVAIRHTFHGKTQVGIMFLGSLRPSPAPEGQAIHLEAYPGLGRGLKAG